MLKQLQYYFFINTFHICTNKNIHEDIVNKNYIDEILVIEENLINNYGTIILKEITEKYIVYICSKEGLISIVNVNKNNFTINKVISNNKLFKKKKFPHTKIILSTGPLNLEKKYLKNKYASTIKITPIIHLVENWEIQFYSNILKLINKAFIEILDTK